MITVKSYLVGEWVSGRGAGTAVIDPSTENAIATASSEGLDLEAALGWGRKTGGSHLRALTFAERGVILKALSKAVHGAREALIECSIESGGTTRSDAKFDIDGASGTLAFYANLGAKLGETTYLTEPSEQLTQSTRFVGQHVLTTRPGIALHVNAFNFPCWGLAEKLAVALLAGVPVMSKPATSTSLLTFRMVEAMVAANVLPEGALQLVCGSVRDLVEKLEPEDVLAFTGSADTGAKLRGAKSVVARSVRLNIEADSLNSAVLAPGAGPGDEVFRAFIRDVTKELTQKAGQKCTATRRIFVPRDVLDEVQVALVEELSHLKVGSPLLDEVRMGPLATAQQLADFKSGLGKLVESGAKIVLGGVERPKTIGIDDGKGYFVAPTLLVADQPDTANAVHEHEVFGPSATLMPYTDAAHAVALVARGQGGLVCSVYGDDRETLKALVQGIAPFHGRILIGSSKVADQMITPGMVLPSCVHGGPGRAGGGEELGGERGLRFYMQRTAIQGDRALIEKLFETPKA
jgi:oxepin-CoA hydrolase/3-oxo-5,6-dehydrosuberyl-CoA semialdehyde dehydrogenase